MTSEDTQVKLAAALTKISSLEREVDTKQRLLEDSAVETERVREGLEKVIKELVAKNRALDSDLRRLQAQHEQEVTEVLRAHEATVAELTDSRRQLSILREAQSTATAQIATGAAVNRELAEECEIHKQRRAAAESALSETQKAMEELRMSEGDSRADVDELIGKLQKADEHLVQLTEEATAASVTASRLKAHAQQIQSERDAAQRSRDELIARIKTPSAGLAELVRGLMRDVDVVLRDAQNILEKSPGRDGGGGRHSTSVSSGAHRSSTPAWFEDETSGTSGYNSLRLWPSNVEGLDDASCIVLGLQRISDVVPVLTDDIALVRRTIAESLRREGDELQQLDVVREALSAERAHVSELAEQARSSAEQAKKNEEEVNRLQSVLQDSAQWMAEAAQLGEERAKKAENLALTIRNLENERNQLMREVTRLREELHHAKLLSDVNSSYSTSAASFNSTLAAANSPPSSSSSSSSRHNFGTSNYVSSSLSSPNNNNYRTSSNPPPWETSLSTGTSGGTTGGGSTSASTTSPQNTGSSFSSAKRRH